MENRRGGSNINQCNNTILQNILGRLPALSFANASCVSKTWYQISSKILSRPKLATAFSLNPSLIGAVGEVTEKILSQPIRPHFAIAYISEQFGLRGAHLLLSQRLGRSTPLVTHIGNGVMGMDGLTHEFREVKWDYFDYGGPHPREANGFSDLNRGIVLTVGYVPGHKVDALPLFRPKTNPGISMVEEFVSNIKNYTASVSSGECESPSAIIMFGDRNSDMNSIVAMIDFAMGKETVMVGDGGGCFLFTGKNYTITYPPDSYILEAVALVFAKDTRKSPAIGEIGFHVAIAGGLMPFGPRFEAITVGEKDQGRWTCLSAFMEEGLHEVLNFKAVIDTILETVSDRHTDLYIGVTQRRRYNSRAPFAQMMRIAASTTFYHVVGGQEEYLMVEGAGIKPGDSFLFYHRDLETARATNDAAYQNLKMLKQKLEVNEESVFGGFIFSSNSRGQSYFGKPYADIYPFALNFPHVPFAGLFCSRGEIGRSSSSSSLSLSSSSSSSSSSSAFLMQQDECQEQSPALHVSSAVYLAISYRPPPSSSTLRRH